MPADILIPAPASWRRLLPTDTPVLRNDLWHAERDVGAGTWAVSVLGSHSQPRVVARQVYVVDDHGSLQPVPHPTVPPRPAPRRLHSHGPARSVVAVALAVLLTACGGGTAEPEPPALTASGNITTTTATNTGSTARLVQVQAAFTYRATAGASGASVVLGVGDGSSPVGLVYLSNMQPGATATGVKTYSGQFLLPAGATGQYSLWLQVNAGPVAVAVADVTLQVQCDQQQVVCK